MLMCQLQLRQQQLAEEERQRQETAEKALREQREAEWVKYSKDNTH